MKKKTALIAGASGLVGSRLLPLLLECREYEKVTAIVRSPLGMQHPKLNEQIVDFDHLEGEEGLFRADDIFCCLGTTIKKAKTQEAMYKIDVDYPLAIAELALKQGAGHYLLISSMNANPKSPIWYPRMKGELEEKLRKIPFETISILRPSLLLGERKEFRLGEQFAAAVTKPLAFLFKGSLRKAKPIQGKNVAIAMYRLAQSAKKGTAIYPSDQIETIAEHQNWS